MKQNKYDTPDFFSRYSEMPRSTMGLKAAGEWESFKSLLPDLNNKRVLDLGCGFGWHCRYARENHAHSVVGVDLSENMLKKARETTHDPKIEYKKAAIEDINFSENEFDIVISSLAFHYIENFEVVCKKINKCLIMGGEFIFSVEHPIFTSIEKQDWNYGAKGEILHWPLDHYQDEGLRHTKWMDDNVEKYHRTFSTYVNSLLASGFSIAKILEPEPPVEMLEERPELKDESRRPMFMIISAKKL